MRLALVAMILPVFVANAHAEEPRELTPLHTRVALFKHGMALVETRVDLGELDGERKYRVASLPPARLGSLWITWPEGIAVEDIRSARVRGEERVAATDITGLLRAAVGERVSLRVGEEWIDGDVLPLPEAEGEPPQWIPPEEAWRSRMSPPAQANLVLLRQADGVVALPLGSIDRVQLSGPLKDATFSMPTWDDALLFRAKHSDGLEHGAPPAVTLRYLVQGLAWSPSYVVELTGEKTARLSAKAIVMNDFADLSEVDAELVAGFPHTPLAATEEATTLLPMHAWLQQLRQATSADMTMANTAGGYLMSQRADYSHNEAAVASMPLTPVAGEASEDLFFFQVDGVSVAKGERLYHPLFSAEVPYTHCYTWDIPDYVDEERGYQDQPAAEEQVVWHALRLTNTTTQPWTTAPGMTMKDGRVLGQDTLHFTPPSAETDLRITQAVSIKAEQSEQEVVRERQAAQFYGYHYDKVTVQGELVVTNYRGEPVTVQVTKTLTGEVDGETTGQPKIVKLARGLRRVNPMSKLTWNVEVSGDDNEAAKLAYRYTVYVRN